MLRKSIFKQQDCFYAESHFYKFVISYLTNFAALSKPYTTRTTDVLFILRMKTW